MCRADLLKCLPSFHSYLPPGAIDVFRSTPRLGHTEPLGKVMSPFAMMRDDWQVLCFRCFVFAPSVLTHTRIYICAYIYMPHSISASSLFQLHIQTMNMNRCDCSLLLLFLPYSSLSFSSLRFCSLRLLFSSLSLLFSLSSLLFSCQPAIVS